VATSCGGGDFFVCFGEARGECGGVQKCCVVGEFFLALRGVFVLM
jgi:hypothetical protein